MPIVVAGRCQKGQGSSRSSGAQVGRGRWILEKPGHPQELLVRPEQLLVSYGGWVLEGSGKRSSGACRCWSNQGIFRCSRDQGRTVTVDQGETGAGRDK